MAARLNSVKLTTTFEANLAEIDAFPGLGSHAGVVDRLLTDLAERVIPNLERWPEMGRLFPDGNPGSIEMSNSLDRIRQQFGVTEIREYVIGEFVMLYAYRGRTVYLLAIKHHRQLSYPLTEQRR